MPGLRERRHQETRQALVDAAFELFAERGFDEVTMDEIARAAGVSRSTAYRRFATKEDVVLEVPRRWLTVFDEAFDAIPDDATVRGATRAICLAVARHIDAEAATVLAAYAVLEQAPTLRSSGLATRAWLDRIVLLVERFAPAEGRSGSTDGLDQGTAGIIAGAYLGAIDAMMQNWATTGGAGSVVDATSSLVDRLEPILP